MEIHFTDRELDIMGVLWDRGSATVAEVRESLADELAYTTVLTMLRILEEKGHVWHEAEGRAHRYFPRVGRQAAGTGALTRLLTKLFKDSPELLLTHLVSGRELSDAEIRRMRELLDRHIAGEEP